MGGDMNAYTTKEYTTFYVRVLAEHVELGLDILCDILCRPALRPDEVDAERQVILEEVLMHRDEPSDVVQEHFANAMFPNHPLGREVLGEPEVIRNVTVGAIRSFFDEHYLPGNMVIAATGDLDHEHFGEGARHAGPLCHPARRAPPCTPTAFGRRRRAHHQDDRASEQAQLVLGFRAPDRHSGALKPRTSCACSEARDSTTSATQSSEGGRRTGGRPQRAGRQSGPPNPPRQVLMVEVAHGRGSCCRAGSARRRTTGSAQPSRSGSLPAHRPHAPGGWFGNIALAKCSWTTSLGSFAVHREPLPGSPGTRRPPPRAAAPGGRGCRRVCPGGADMLRFMYSLVV